MADDHPLDGRESAARRPGLHLAPRCAQPRRPQGGVRRLLGRVRRVPQLVRRGLRRQGQGRHLPRQGAQVPDRARRVARRPTNIPEAVYRTLVAETNAGLPQLHRYFELRRRRCSGLPDIGYYDIYPPLVLARPQLDARPDARDRAARRSSRSARTTSRCWRSRPPQVDGPAPAPGQGIGRLHEARAPTTCTRTCCSTRPTSTRG